MLASASEAFPGPGAAGVEGALAFILIFFLFILVLFLLVLVLLVVSLWKMFVKAGEPGWTTLVPFYNTAKMLEIVSLPLWWILLLCIPMLNIIPLIILTHRIAVVFGKGRWFTVGLILLPYIFYPIIGLGKARYANTYPPAKPMTEATKWALIGAGVIVAIECFFIMTSLLSSSAGPLSVIHDTRTDSPGYDEYATDGRFVYHYYDIVEGADPYSFQLIGEYGMDDGHVYYEGITIDGADRWSFKPLDGDYAQDADHIYYMGDVVDDANPATFNTIDEDYAEDAQHVYFDSTELTGADPATFTVLDATFEYSKDANHVYNAGQEMKGADPATFQVVSGTIDGKEYDAKDAKHYYDYGKIVH
jgi:hypothetical protein